MLALKLLLRHWRGGELKLLSLSLVLAVSVLSGIAIFTDRLESSLLRQSNSVIGADAVLRSSQPYDPTWEQEAQAQGISYTRANVFMSVVYAGDEMLLSSIKAVDEGYPLRGEFEISELPYAIKPEDIRVAKGIPAEGEVWVDSRLLSALKIQLGDKVAVGEYELVVKHLLIHEPDGVNQFSVVGTRLIMNIKDLAKTQINVAGSNIDYQWLLAAADHKKLDAFIAALKPRLTPSQRIVDINSAQERLAKTLGTARSFLMLSAVIAVLLASLAIAIAARQFADRHTNQVALMKSLGVSGRRIRSIYFGQLLLLGAMASLVGLLFGYGIQEFVALSLQRLYQIVLADSSLYPYMFSLLSGLVCVTFFALPALWFLPQIPPLKILRRELAVSSTQVLTQAGFILLAIVVLMALFTRDLKMALSILLGLAGVLALSLLAAWALLMASRKLALNLGGVWRLAFSNIQRRRGHSLIQIIVFAIALMLLLTLTIIRTSLIEDWKMQIPDKAANHFLSNIAAENVDDIRQLLEVEQVAKAPIYPMVRGRLTEINALAPSEELRRDNNSLRRELNLTWSAQLAEDNKLVEGVWWDEWKKSEHDLPGVSVEEETARKLGLKLGDKLHFSIGGLQLDAEVASLRSVNWRSMKPNFFFIFEPELPQVFSPTYMTSIYLPKEQKPLINKLLRQYPTILVVELDRILDNISTLVSQVSDAVLLVLWLTLAGGCLVLLAAVMNSIASRKQEAGLLRALGSSRQLILGSVLIEFAILGLLSGIIAILGAELVLANLQFFVFKNPVRLHGEYWLWSPLIGCLFVALLGAACCRKVVTTPPMVVLREAT
ncbi:MAG TPA: FtsX-like permease family protein [Cellvibrio sp.]|nr:FtsX-like permease family protein [Cellvibrio sp.]